MSTWAYAHTTGDRSAAESMREAAAQRAARVARGEVV